MGRTRAPGRERSAALFAARDTNHLTVKIVNIRELDTVVLEQNCPAHGLSKGDIGTVALTHQRGAGYEVEFVTLQGGIVAVVTLTATQVRPVRRLRNSTEPRIQEFKEESPGAGRAFL